MADFEPAIKKVLLHEGGFVNDPRDSGGATNYGVSLRWLKSIGDSDKDGRLDGDLDFDGDVDIDDVKGMTVARAKEFYKKHWWDKYSYGEIKSQFIADKVFDLAVNMGAKQAHKCLQRAVLRTHACYLLVDGILGKKTLAAVNEANVYDLYKRLEEQAEKFYRSLNRPEYLDGWLNRVYS